MGINDDESVFLPQEEQEHFLLTQTELDSKESDEYKQGFENSIMEVHWQYNLRSKKTSETLNSKNSKNHAKKSSDTYSSKTIDNSLKKTIDNSSKNKVETPAKKIVDSVSKTTQTDIPTTSE